MPVNFSPAIRRNPLGVAFPGNRESGRSQCEDDEEQRLVVSAPTVAEIAGLRSPTVRYYAVAKHPPPVGTAVKYVRQFANCAFIGRLAVEILCSNQRPGKENGRIDGRQLTSPRSSAALHLEEMVEESLVASRCGTIALFGSGEEFQNFASLGRGSRPRLVTVLDGSDVTCQCHSRACNARGRIR